MSDAMSPPFLRPVACLAVALLVAAPSAVLAAAADPDVRAPGLARVCAGGIRAGASCTLNQALDDCNTDGDCFGGSVCDGGRCNDCPGGRCTFAHVTTGFIKGVLTVIADEHVSSGGSDNSSTSQCNAPDSNVGTQALTVILEVKGPNGPAI